MSFLDLKDNVIEKERFSLLLLEPGEIYFEDFSVHLYPWSQQEKDMLQNKQRGRLKICSKSIVFDPKDFKFPILKFLFIDITALERWTASSFSQNNDKHIYVETNQVIEMKQDNVVVPFVFKKTPVRYVMELIYGCVDSCLPQMCQLQRASTLPPGDQYAMINAIVIAKQNMIQFDLSWLEDLHEKIILETHGEQVTPLVTNPGRVMLTPQRLYFQPFNNIGVSRVMKIKLSNFRRVIKRRFLLRHVGIEIFCRVNSSCPHFYLALIDQDSRNALYDKIIEQSELCLDDMGQENTMLRWQNGVISNFEYLLYLNSLADRSVYDLTQYPVFPWVLSDYTSSSLDLQNPKSFRDLSKPIGALNQDRLHRLLERYKEMPEPKFMYGSHYSSPGYILFYLTRIAPEYMLCLQNGRFDQPDRMFNSISEAWNNCLTSYTDFKELIPEFFDSSGDFLENNQMINFGSRHDGRVVGSVDLPPWARDSQDFVVKMREALECDHVSQHLHQWIDLIFGYKQQGAEAEEACNVYYHLTYEGAVDLDSIEDLNERAALKVQIMEFGQTPKQLFDRPHPRRYNTFHHEDVLKPDVSITQHATHVDDHTASVDNLEQSYLSVVTDATCKVDIAPTEQGGATNICDTCGLMELQQGSPTCTCSVRDVIDSDDSYHGAKQEATNNHTGRKLRDLHPYHDYTLHKDLVTDVTWNSDASLVVSVSKDSLLKVYSVAEEKQIHSVSPSHMTLSSCRLLPDEQTVITGSWDNNIYVYSLEYGRVLDTCYAHDDAVSSLCLKDDLLVSSSWDSTVKLWQWGSSRRQSGLQLDLVGDLDHDTGVTCSYLGDRDNSLACGTRDGNIYVWDIATQSLIAQHFAHDGEVNAVSFSPDCHRLVSCGEDGYLKVIDINSGTQIYSKHSQDVLGCLTWSGKSVVAGSSAGRLLVWDLASVEIVEQTEPHPGPISCLDVSHSMHVVTGSNSTVTLWKSS